MKKIVLVALILSLFTSCNDNDGCGCPDNSNTIRIGVLLNQSGISLNQIAAIEIASEDIEIYLEDNSIEKNLELTIENFSNNPDIAFQKLLDMYSKGIRLIIGLNANEITPALKAFADENSVLLLSISCLTNSLSLPDDNLFSMAPDISKQGKAIAALMEYDGIERIVSLAGNEPWAKDVLESFKNNFNGAVHQELTYEATDPDLEKASSDLEHFVQDAIDVSLEDGTGILLLTRDEGTELLSNGPDNYWMGLVSWYGGSLYSGNPDLLTDTLAFEFAMNRSLSCPIHDLNEDYQDAWKPILEKVKSKTGNEANISALDAYDALWLAFHTYLSTGPDPGIDKLKSTLVSLSTIYPGKNGPVNFDSNGNRDKPVFGFYTPMVRQGEHAWIKTSLFDWESSRIIMY